MAFPQYLYPPDMIAALSRDFLLLRKRDFHQDAKACIARLIPPLVVIGAKIFQAVDPAPPRSITLLSRRIQRTVVCTCRLRAYAMNMHWTRIDEFTYRGLGYELMDAICVGSYDNFYQRIYRKGFNGIQKQYPTPVCACFPCGAIVG
jgi:hypothetical protein